MDYKEKIISILTNKELTSEQKQQLETIFPELKESEDEKIRKALIEYFSEQCDMSDWNGVYGYQVLAWLEKQVSPQMVADAYLRGCNDTEKKLSEKQGEQKPTDKLEPKFKVKYASNEYNVLDIKDIAGVTFYGIEDEPNHIDYVQAENCERVGGYGIKENGSPYPTKPAVFSEQKPAWSEDDEEKFNKTLFYVKNQRQDVLRDTMLVEWLKSLRDRLQH